MSNSQQGPMENLLDGLSQHARFLSREERKAELRDRGVKVDEFLNEAHSIIAKHLKEDRLAWMKIADDKRRQIVSKESSLESWVNKGEEVIRAAWEEFLASTSPQRALAFRNKKDLTIEDIARILDDHERLRLRQTSNEK
jgi:hypothetical protein